MKKYKAIGLMSGTSLDGVDIAACEFVHDEENWRYTIHAAHTFPYPLEWKQKLARLPFSDALTLAKVNIEYGHYLGRLVNSFLESTSFAPTIIASHGHTIFHQPQHGLTLQVGSGSAIAGETRIPVVCDFRSLDIALGGQGAPLVPIGDRLLFNEYGACLNIGGFANLSMELNQQRIAFDICPVNIVLNDLARQLNLEFDPNGENARSGNINEGMLQILNHLGFYNLPFPKSLGREWVDSEIKPIISSFPDTSENLLRTFTEHIAIQISNCFSPDVSGNILSTGGGAKNVFLMERIRTLSPKLNYIIPDPQLIDFKEALVFAFIGILRYLGKINVLSSVTGSNCEHSGGAVYLI